MPCLQTEANLGFSCTEIFVIVLSLTFRLKDWSKCTNWECEM